MKTKILVLSSDDALAASLRPLLDPAEFALRVASDSTQGLSLLRRERPAAIVTRPGEDWRELRAAGNGTPILIAVEPSEREQVLEAVEHGAADFVELPVEETRFRVSLRNAIERKRLATRAEELSRELRGLGEPTALIGRSAAFREVATLLTRAVRSEVNLLIGGEPGTGKTTAAHRVHAKSARRSGPFMVVDARGASEQALTDELFGGTADSSGAIESADKGTLLIEHVEELPRPLQERVLRFLESGSLSRGGRSVRPNVRWIFTTECPLEEYAREDRFSGRLFFRIAVFPIVLPPLRERVEDIPLFAQAFVERFARAHGKDVHGISPAALQALEAFPWPGNVRELENTIERAIILADDVVLRTEFLPSAVVRSAFPEGAPQETAAANPAPGLTLLPPHEVLPFRELERRILLHALRTTGWNVQEAARRLKLGRATVYRKIDRYGLEREAG